MLLDIIIGKNIVYNYIDTLLILKFANKELKKFVFFLISKIFTN